MGKLLFLAILAGGGWWAWQNGLVAVPAEFAAPTPAWESYTEFSERMAQDDYVGARALATKGAVRTVQVAELRGRRNTRLAVGRIRVSQDQRERAALGEIRGISYERLSETASADGEIVAIRALQRICRDRGECEDVEHAVEVCKTGDVWKVCSFRAL